MAENGVQDRVKLVFSDVLDIDLQAISDDLGPENCDSWDSMNNLRLITALEEEFGISFSMEEISSMVDISRVFELIERKG
ncbi:acyl carrier protein [Acaryochloris sp. CCMEE 5410]|uniref:acyl carrier protein n=1 Tax=Acaryochloris sp. CCMEE 5410 TaxID=310037 RepID=UPI0002484C60|nr:acyl carrier protein [Acaryochloris sp. CCMEE 5410]KAI9134455.1 acyl carrier protein [Acaryochloris sp. CCMEE 5410]